MSTPHQVLNRRIVQTRPLITPLTLREEVPLTGSNEALVVRSRSAVTDVLDGRDDRLLVIVGPCSIHDPAAALHYARGLARIAAHLTTELCVVMRVYFEKPRTTIGWKGLINDPGLDGSFDVNRGLRTARGLLLDTLALGLPVGCEFLDPIIPQYLADAVSWGSIGARTAQSQIHRQLASGLSMPVGIKNSTDGDVQSAVDAAAAAAYGHVFPGITDDGRAAIFATAGNPDCHVVLRGGSTGPNSDGATVADALDKLDRASLPRRVVIDASHGNSRKEPELQVAVATDVAARVATGEPGIAGLMLESFLVSGRQELVLGRAASLTYGQSVTDACMDMDETSSLLRLLATSVTNRRHALDR